MLEGFYGWISTIAVTIIFAAFIEMLMPDNKMKKYIKLVLGLLIMAVILEPVLKYINKNYSLSGYSFKYSNIMDSSYIKQESETYSQKQQDSVVRLYKQNLEDKMADGIKNLISGKDVSVSVEIVEDIKNQNFGEIKKATVTLKDSIKKVDKVDKVQLGKEEDTSPKKPDKNYSDLKNKISALFDIDISKIEIIDDTQS